MFLIHPIIFLTVKSDSPTLTTNAIIQQTTANMSVSGFNVFLKIRSIKYTKTKKYADVKKTISISVFPSTESLKQKAMYLLQVKLIMKKVIMIF